ncbi:MAG: ATP-binding cassette domain-containing protein, partial [Sphingomonas sp.]
MAAPILSFEGLGLVQGSGWLFRELDIHVGARDRLALIGRNGAGKTTLLKLLGARIDAEQLQQGGLARAVAADQRQPVARAD